MTDCPKHDPARTRQYPGGPRCLDCVNEYAARRRAARLAQRPQHNWRIDADASLAEVQQWLRDNRRFVL